MQFLNFQNCARGTFLKFIFSPFNYHLPVAVYDGCGSVAFIYLAKAIFVVPMKAQSHLWLLTVWELFGVWGCLVVVFAAILCLCVQ